MKSLLKALAKSISYHQDQQQQQQMQQFRSNVLDQGLHL